MLARPFLSPYWTHCPHSHPPVATVSKSKGAEEAFMGDQERIVTLLFWKPSPVRAGSPSSAIDIKSFQRLPFRDDRTVKGGVLSRPPSALPLRSTSHPCVGWLAQGFFSLLTAVGNVAPVLIGGMVRFLRL